MSIDNPRVLFLLILLLPIIGIFIWIYKLGICDIRAITHGDEKEKMADFYFKKYFFSSLCFIMALVFLILSLANFKWQKVYVTENPDYVDVVFAVDVSNSMLANDIVPNRLERVKSVLLALVQQKDLFRFSLVAFKGSAVVQIPMTEDALSFNHGVQRLSPALITTPGTDLAEGLFSALEAFPSGKESRKLVVVFSDGAEGVLKGEKKLQAQLLDEKVKVISVGCGTAEGGLVNLDGGSILLDENSQPRRLFLHPQLLKSLALWTEGDYLNLESPSIIADLNKQFQAEAGWIGAIKYSISEPSQYQLFLILALFSLFGYIFIRSRKMGGLF